MAVTTQPRLIKYNNKDYDFDSLQQTVLNNYDKYARQFGYSRSKYEKDRQGLNELLSQMRSDTGATVDPYQITFSSRWGNEKGAFGKARNKSRHYKNPTWMIIDTLQGMNAYDPNANKKKLNADVLNQELTSGFAGINGMKDAGNRKQATIQVINDLLSKYNNNLDNYVLDEGFVYDDYKNKLNALISAINSDSVTDDELAFWNLNPNLTNPLIVEESKPEEKDDGYKTYRDQLRNLDVEDSEIETIIAKRKQKDKEKLIKEILGEESSSTQSSGSSSTSSSNTGVVAASTQQEKPTQQEQPTQQEKPKVTVESDEDKLRKALSQALEKGHRHITFTDKKQSYSYDDNKKQWKEVNYNTNKKFTQVTYKHKNGAKLSYIKNIKKYDDGDIIQINKEGVDDDSFTIREKNNLIGTIGPLGYMLPGWGKLLGLGAQAYDIYNNWNDYDNAQRAGDIVNAATNAILSMRGLKTDYNPKQLETYNKNLKLHDQRFTPERQQVYEKAVNRKKTLQEDVTKAKEKLPENTTYESISRKAEASRTPDEKAYLQAEDAVRAYSKRYKNLLNFKTNWENSNSNLRQEAANIETVMWNPDLKTAAIGTGINGLAQLTGSGGDFDEFFNRPNFGYVAAPFGMWVGSKISPTYTWIKEKRGPGELNTPRPLFEETSGSTTGTTASTTPKSSRFAWIKKIRDKFKGGSSTSGTSSGTTAGAGAATAGAATAGTTAALTGLGLLALPSVSQGMNTAYDIKGINGTEYIDPNTGLRGILRGATVDNNGNLDVIDYMGIPVIPTLRGPIVSGQMDNRLKNLGMYIDEKTGKSMIPGVNYWTVMNNPELRNLVDKSGAEFDMQGRYVGEIKPYNDSFGNRTFGRVGGQVKHWWNTSGENMVKGLARIGAEALRFNPIVAMSEISTSSNSRLPDDFLENYRRDNYDWNLGNMYIPYNEYKP